MQAPLEEQIDHAIGRIVVVLIHDAAEACPSFGTFSCVAWVSKLALFAAAVPGGFLVRSWIAPAASTAQGLILGFALWALLAMMEVILGWLILSGFSGRFGWWAAELALQHVAATQGLRKPVRTCVDLAEDPDGFIATQAYYRLQGNPDTWGDTLNHLRVRCRSECARRGVAQSLAPLLIFFLATAVGIPLLIAYWPDTSARDRLSYLFLSWVSIGSTSAIVGFPAAEWLKNQL